MPIGPDEFKAIGVAYSGTAEANAALAVARDLAAVEGARLPAMTAVRLIRGAVGHWSELDLLVVGSRGHGPLRRLIRGSTLPELTREARRRLLMIRAPIVAEHMPNAD